MFKIHEMQFRIRILSDSDYARKCCGSGSVRSVCFWASWILQSSSKIVRKNL
jgi:hypothetical protein